MSVANAIRVTQKQILIMTEIFKGEPAGFITLANLVRRLPYKPTKRVVQCSLDFLRDHGVVEFDHEVRDGRRQRVIKPTPLGFQIFRGITP
jgi:hypothetical protein